VVKDSGRKKKKKERKEREENQTKICPLENPDSEYSI